MLIVEQTGIFRLERGWCAGVWKSCSAARAICTDAEGGKEEKGEADISALLAEVQANPWCVCLYLCADWWNELRVWEIDSGCGWSPPPPTPPPPHTLLSPLRLCFLLPAGRLVLLACFLSLKLKERGEGGGSAGGGGGSGAATQTRWDILFSPSLIRLTRCLLATGWSGCIFSEFHSPHRTWRPNHLSSSGIPATSSFNITWRLFSVVSEGVHAGFWGGKPRRCLSIVLDASQYFTVPEQRTSTFLRYCERLSHSGVIQGYE